MLKVNHAVLLLCAGAVCLAVAACGGSSASGNLGGEKPVLALSKSTVMFAGIEGSSANPASASVDLTNTGTGSLSFIAASDSPWLAVTPSNGIAPQTLQISATIGSLTANTYTGHILVTAAGAQGSPATVTITFMIGAPAASTSPFWQQWGSNPAAYGHGSGRRAELSPVRSPMLFTIHLWIRKKRRTPQYLARRSDGARASADHGWQ